MLYVTYEPNEDNPGYHPVEWACLECGKSGFVKEDGIHYCPDHPNAPSYPIYLGTPSSYYQEKKYSSSQLEVVSASEFIVKVNVFRLRTSLEPVDGRHLILNPMRRSKIRLSIENGLHYQIEENGQEINPTKTNLIKALSNTKWRIFDKTILEAISDETHSAKDFVNWLIDHPEYEKLMIPAGPESYSMRAMYHIVYGSDESASLVDKTASQPHEILGLGSKSLFRLVAQNASLLCSGDVKLNTIREMIDRFGPQVTENILNLALDLVRKNERNDTRSISIKMYLSILSRDDVTYNPKQLLDYVLFRVYRFQGISNPDTALMLLRDYLNLMRRMGVKPEKYPRSLKLAHDIAMKNCNVVLNYGLEAKFQDIIHSDDYQSLCMNGKDYCILTPKSMKDLVYEANSLNHCVDSYIEDVADGTAKIYFLRSTDAPDVPLMTLDVRNNVLYQAAGSSNRDPSPKEKAVIKAWTEKHGINYMCQ